MGKRRSKNFDAKEIVEFLTHLVVERPLFHVLIALIAIGWVIERWVFSFSSWVSLAIAIWATIQYGNHQRQNLVEDLNKKWKRIILHTSPVTPLEHCEWLNKLLMEIWPNFVNPKLSIKFSSIVEKRMKHLKSRLIEKVELLEFSLGSSPPSLGLHGTRWATSGDQKIMRLGFDWDTNDMSILLHAKLAKPLLDARIVINSLHIKGELLVMPILDGRAVLYSFVSAPEVRIGVAFGKGGSQSLPATELPGVSSWLVKIFTDTLVKTMVEPRRQCFSFPAVELRRKAVGGVLSVTVISADKLSRTIKGSPPRRLQSSSTNGSFENFSNTDLKTFVEVELGELNRRTEARSGYSPKWDAKFNMVLHGDAGILRFHIYECIPNSMKYDDLGSCEIKMKYVADGSTTFWAVGPDFSIIARRTELCGEEVEIILPFEGINSGELKVRLELKEWQFADGSHSFKKFHVNSGHSMGGSSNFPLRTGRKLHITIVEGKDLVVKDKSGKCDPYVKMQYGEVSQRTSTVKNATNPVWNQKFEFDEVHGGEYLKIKCYSEEYFGDDNIGSARVNLEGLVEGSLRDVWIPLEKVTSGELRLQIQAVRSNGCEGPQGASARFGNALIELVLVEAKDLVAADLRGTSDPYVRVQYGNIKKRTKVMKKTLNPVWNQMLEFPDDGSPLELQVRDHNALFPTASIGNCVVEYQRLPFNQMYNKWIPLQGVTRGEIHIQITRKVPEINKRPRLESEASITRAHQISIQMKQMMTRFQTLMEESNLEGLSAALKDLENLEEMQDEYMQQLETEQMLLLNKIKELGQEIGNSSPPLSRKSSRN
ncbi:C2 domain [Dillenia turbinata]|uniref:C2 domain n=1 Tax=Dillenia turbinata TaxID=194707 RepID=A0AAN8Z7H2_9MAGN